MNSMTNNQKESWNVGNYKINVLPDDEFQQLLKHQRQLEQIIESMPLPTDPNVDLVKKIHSQLPITNWAWELTKQREHEVKLKKQKQRIAQQSLNYPTNLKKPDNGLSL